MQSTITYYNQILQYQQFRCNLSMVVKLYQGQTISYKLQMRKSKARIVHTGVPQNLKLSNSLFSFYLADMPRPTEPLKRIYYADDIIVWASGVKIPELEHKVNLFDGDVPFLTGYFTIDISTKHHHQPYSLQARRRPLPIQSSRCMTLNFPSSAVQSYKECI